MSELTKKKDYKNFIFTHKKFLVLFVLIALSFVCVPHIYEQIKGEDATIALQLKYPDNSVNSEENPYILDSVDDFIILQEFSKNNDCYGMYFEVGNTLKNNKLSYSEDEEDEEGSEAGNIVYNLNLTGTIVLEDESKAIFSGIGQNFHKPFRGNIMFSGITIRLDTPLFCFLGSGASIEELNMFGKIRPIKMKDVVGGDVAVGTLASMAILDSDTESLDISTVSVSNKTEVDGGTKPSGGLIGAVHGDPRQIRVDRFGVAASKAKEYNINLDKIAINDEIFVTTSGNASVKNGFANNTTGALHSNYAADSGGVIGVVTTTYLNINVNFKNNTYVNGRVKNSKNAVGGVIGAIYDKVCVKFEGNVDVQGLTALDTEITGLNVQKGYVIGTMSNPTLAYVTEGKEIKRPVNAELEKSIEVGFLNNTVGGQIFKNTNKSLLGKNAAIVTGTGTDADPYIIDSIDDFECLSALLCSQGYFGCWYNETTKKYDTWFTLPDTVSNTTIANIVNHVKKATYQISADLDLSSRGIEKINRHGNEAFQGSMLGLKGTYKDGNEYPTVYQNIDSYNVYVSLIPYARGNYIAKTTTEPEYTKDLVFKDLIFDGKVSGAYKVYGLIYDYTNANSYYSGIKFENIEMSFDVEAKESNDEFVVGFIGYARYNSLTSNISSQLNMDFKNIKYTGNLYNNGYGAAYGAGLIGYLYPAHNNMSSINEGNKLTVNIENYEFCSEEVKATGNGANRICSTIYGVSYSAGYVNETIAGITTSIYHRPVINMNNINIHDSVWTNGANDYDQMSGVLAYSLTGAEVKLNNININNVDYNLRTGFGFFFINDLTYSLTDINKVTFENVDIYKEKNTANENYDMGAFINSAQDAVITVRDYIVNNSNIYMYGARGRTSETVYNMYASDNTYMINKRGLFSFEGNDRNGNRYNAVNTYDHQFKYTNKDDTTQDYYPSSITGWASSVSYNTISNMSGKYISGTGTKDDPFVINDEAKLTLFSNYTSISIVSLDYFIKYFSDIEEILTEEDKTTLSWVKKKQKLYHRILTGYYVFAKDMDLSEHAYYPAMNCTGNYYGFDAYEFTGRSSLTDEELKTYCAGAISALEDRVSSNGISPETVVKYKPEIYFSADKVVGGIRGIQVANASSGVSPTAQYGIHIKMHGGLFGVITGYNAKGYARGNVNISNFKFTGVACGTASISRGGAFLVSGYNQDAIKNAKVNISNIDFQNAMIINGFEVGNAETTKADGLLVEMINNSQVNITGIKILADANGNANIRASALIGYQTGTNSKVIFRDIDLNAVIDQGTITPKDPTNTAEYLPIDKVDFETTEKEAYFRSAPTNTDEATMTDAEKEQLAAFKKYGYGFRYGYFYYNLSAGAAIYYYDVGTEVMTPGRTAPSLNINTKILSNDILLKQVQKYAYRTMRVDVNPESANIIHGTGTKEDPYIIENLGQLVTLSNFIRYKGDIIDYKTWYVGESDGTGYDVTDPSTWANETNLIYKNRYESDEVDNRIKSVEYLTQAHYKITENIDFSNPNSYFAQTAERFNGIGIEDYPFRGSIIGEKKADGTYPKIYIGNSSETYLTSFGIIQYAKGVEIKNLDICAGKSYVENIRVATGAYSYVESDGIAKICLNYTSSKAGILINNLMGGDNIIDNVGIGAFIQLNYQQGNYCYIGGYVGVMRSGTLTIGNMKKSTFENFIVKYINNGKYYESNYATAAVKYTSAIVGDYYNGCIIIKDEDLDANKVSVDTSRVVTVETVEETVNGTTVTTKYNTVKVDDIKYYNRYGIPCCLEYNPINYNYLETMNNNRIKVIKDEREEGVKLGSFICQIEDSDQLFLLSLMTNSGSLSPVNNTTIEVPYTTRSSTHKYEEDFTNWLTNENAEKGADNQITLTEKYDMPMFFKYFDFTALDNSYKDVYINGNCLLSTGLTNYPNNRTTYILNNPNPDYVYDMSEKYGSAFQGIGPHSQVHHYEAGSNIHMNAALCFSANFDGNGHDINVNINTIGYTGLFTVLKSANNNINTPYKIKNFVLRGKVNQKSGLYYGITGGVVGIHLSGYIDFENITLAGLKVSNQTAGQIGGFAGSADSISKFYDIKIGLKDEIDENGVVITDNSVLIDGTTAVASINVGGLMGTSNCVKADEIKITNTELKGLASVGGIVGYINLYGTNYDTYINNVNITDTVIETKSKNNAGVGMIIGHSTTYNASVLTYPMAIHNVKLSDSKLIAPEGSTAGIIEGFHTGVAFREVLKFEYKNIKDNDNKLIDKVWDCRAKDDTCTYIYHNHFYELEKAEELFGIDRKATDDDGNFIVKYAECLETNLLSPDANNDGNPDEDLDLIPAELDLIEGNDENIMDNVMLRWSSDNGTMESVINSLLNSLTGGTGLINDKDNLRITVKITPMQVKDGVVSQRTDGEEFFEIIKSGGQFVFGNNNKFDTFEKEDSPATYSILTISYTVVNNSAHSKLTRFTESIQIPIFISNMINVDVYSKVMIGQEYDVEVMRAIERTFGDAQTTTKDSSYTVYTEYIYGSNRIDFDEELYMNKGFRLFGSADVEVQKGTKLTLIDLTFEDDPKTYYYEVKENTKFIPLAYFTDELGNAYKERDINKLSELPVTKKHKTLFNNGRRWDKYDRGIEKYLLFVDCTKVKMDYNPDEPEDEENDKKNESEISPFIINGVAEEQAGVVNKEVFYVKYRTYNTLSTYNGRKIEFIEDSIVTEGEINKEKQLNVKVNYSDIAKDYYWDKVKPYDYNNLGKYLEVAVYLKNDKGEKVMLPSGTRIMYPGSSTVFESVKNTSVLFYYKDGVKKDGYALMDKTENTTETVEFTLDFTYAKMDKLPSGKYKVCFDLVRNTNIQYPMGDDVIDTIESNYINVTAGAEYGFRLDTNGKDTLAFNIADIVEEQSSEVNFGAMVSSTLPADIADSKNAVIKFNLYKKDDVSGNFVQYKEDIDMDLSDIELQIVYNNSTESINLNEGEYEFIINGISGVTNEGVSEEAIRAECTLRFPYDADINNYKLKAELYIDGYKQASDFFIVNLSDISH